MKRQISSHYGTGWYLPDRKPTIAKAMRLLELKRKPVNRQELRQQMSGWRSSNDAPWGIDCGSVDEWISVKCCRDAYLWLAAQLP